MKQFHLAFLFALLLIGAFGQTTVDSIAFIKKPRVFFMKNGQPINYNEFETLIQSIPEAEDEVRQAKGNQAGALIFSYTGGFLIGWPIGTAIGGGKPNWALAGIGLGLCLISIPFSKAYLLHTEKAVDAYNEFNRSTVSIKPSWQIGLSQNGLGVRLKF